MIKQNGFTLLEMLVVLGMWSILILLSAPILFSSLDKQQEKQFLETLQSDVLYVQSMSIGSPEKNIVIRFNKNQYSILDNLTRESFITRELPADYVLDSRTAKNISFNKRGNISKPGTIALKTKRTKYNIVFPLGKARCYIAQQ